MVAVAAVAFAQGGTPVRAADPPAPGPSSESWVDDFFSLNIDARTVLDKLRAAFGPRFSSAWIDRSVSPSGFRVALTAVQPADQGVVWGITGVSSRVTVVPARHSETDYDGYVARTRLFLNRHKIRAVSISGNRWKEELTLHLNAALSAAELSELRALVPQDVLHIGVNDQHITMLHNTREDYPPYEGALDLLTPVGTRDAEECTSSFTMRNSASGLYYGTTAGHCNDVGAEVYIGPHDTGSAVGTNGCRAAGRCGSTSLHRLRRVG